MNKEELAELLKKELDPNLDYFDATPAIEAIAEHVRGLHRLVYALFESVGLQGVAILDIREKMIAQKGAIEFLADTLGCERDEGPLVGLKKPAIIMPRKPN